MLVPTLPRPYTVAEVEAEPVLLNSRLGTYTNFVNLLDLCAIAVPSGMRGDGLPSSVTLIAPAGADGVVAGFAAAIHAASGAPAGATGRPAENAPTAPASAPPGRIGLAVVGAHLSGLPLNPRTRRARRVLRRRGRDGAGLSPLRARQVEAGEARSRPRRGRRGRGDQGGSLGAGSRKLSAPLSPEFPPRSELGPSGSRTGRTSRVFWSSPRGSSARRTFRAFGGWRAYLASLKSGN